MCDELALDELIDDLLAQSFDIHRPARRKVQQCLLALSRTVEATAATRDRSRPAARTISDPHTGHLRWSRTALGLAGRRSSRTRTTSG